MIWIWNQPISKFFMSSWSQIECKIQLCSMMELIVISTYLTFKQLKIGISTIKQMVSPHMRIYTWKLKCAPRNILEAQRGRRNSSILGPVFRWFVRRWIIRIQYFFEVSWATWLQSTSLFELNGASIQQKIKITATLNKWLKTTFLMRRFKDGSFRII